MTEAGFTLSGTEHPICPVMLYDAALASSFADELLSRGIYVIGFSFPVVPKGWFLAALVLEIKVQLTVKLTVKFI